MAGCNEKSFTRVENGLEVQERRQVMLKILQLCHFDYDLPRSGGQKRVAALREWLIKSGHRMSSLIVGPDVKSGKSDSCLRVNTDYLLDSSRNPWLFLEERLMDAPLEVDHPEIENFFLRQRPDIVLIEHPWLFPMLKRLIEKHDLSVGVIYSSHNIESDLKAQILMRSEMSSPDQERIISKIELCEIAVARVAKLTICVSEHDKKWYLANGARAAIVASNRIVLRRASRFGAWRYNIAGMKQPYAVFVGSPHPPNISGFLYMLGENMGFLPKNFRVYLIGGVANSIRSHRDFLKFSKTNDKRVVYMPDVSDAVLANVLSGAKCILLPMVEGGGSNLKTIEALLGGRRVLATSKAFVGHEEFLSDPLVTIIDSPEDFRHTLVKILSEPLVSETRSDTFRLKLSWDEQFKKLQNYFS